MTSLKTRLGPHEVTVHAPAVGEYTDDTARELATNMLAADGMIGLDVETTAHKTLGPLHKDFRVRTVQFGSQDVAWVLRMDDPRQRTAAEILLRYQGLRFCSHTRFDVLAVWREFGVDISDRWADTRLLARMANPLSLDRFNRRTAGAEVDLKSLTTKHIGPELAEWDARLDELFRELWVEQGGRKNAAKQAITEYGFTNVPLDNEVFVTYAGLDAIACRRLFPILYAATRSSARLVATELWLAGAIVRMQMRGMRVDRDRLAAEHEAAQQVCASAEEELVELIGLNPRQNKKLVEWFVAQGVDFAAYDHEKTDAGQWSLDKDAVAAMQGYEMPPAAKYVAKLLAQYKSEQYTVTKAEEMMRLVDESFDGRLHPEVDSLGAITARMTSSAPNIQNYSKADPRMRATLLPDPGHVLIGADFDQVELRVCAALTQERSMLETIWSGGDLHQLTADRIGCDRQVAKRINFLQVYGGGPKPLAAAADIPLAEAKAATDAYKRAYPAVQQYMQRLSNSGREIRTMTNRHIPATKYRGEPATYRFINYMIQSSSRDLLVMAMNRMERAGFGDGLFVPIHDELIYQVPEERLDEALQALQSAMTMDFLGVPITASSVALIDEDGVSRWMTCDRAEKAAKARDERAEVAA